MPQNTARDANYCLCVNESSKSHTVERVHGERYTRWRMQQLFQRSRCPVDFSVTWNEYLRSHMNIHIYFVTTYTYSDYLVRIVGSLYFVHADDQPLNYYMLLLLSSSTRTMHRLYSDSIRTNREERERKRGKNVCLSVLFSLPPTWRHRCCTSAIFLLLLLLVWTFFRGVVLDRGCTRLPLGHCR